MRATCTVQLSSVLSLNFNTRVCIKLMKDTADCWGEAWAFSRKADFTAYQQNLVGEKKWWERICANMFPCNWFWLRRLPGLHRGSTFSSGSVTSAVGWIVRVGFPGFHRLCVLLPLSQDLCSFSDSEHGLRVPFTAIERHIHTPHWSSLFFFFSTCDSNRNK